MGPALDAKKAAHPHAAGGVGNMQVSGQRAGTAADEGSCRGFGVQFDVRAPAPADTGRGVGRSGRSDMGEVTQTVDRWTEVEPILREKAYRRLDTDPQVLLEQDAWFNIDADLIFARLYGLDGEIVRDGWQLRSIEPRVLLPIIPRIHLASSGAEVPTLNVATYVLQSGYARVPMDAVYAPRDVEIRPDGTFVVLYLRYRRRL